MPKEVKDMLRKYVKEFNLSGNYFSTDDQIITCKPCDKRILVHQKSDLTKHTNSASHKLKIISFDGNTESEKSFIEEFKNQSEFNKFVCEAFVEANIPFHKLNYPKFNQLLKQCNKFNIPDESTLRKNYLPKLYNDKMNEIKKIVDNKKIWVSVDETSDTKLRCIANVLVGVLDDETQKSHLINCVELEKVNSKTIGQLVKNSLEILQVRPENVLLFVTDAARYMGKAYKKELKGLFTKMIHVTCLAHGLHRVCDFIRLQFTDVDDLIANVKNIYKKSPKRILNFKKVAPNLSLPPKPIITRWGTWVQAAIYYANNLEIIQKIINSLNPEEAVSINIVQKLFKKPTLKENLIYIKSNFSFLPSIINKLQGNVSLCDSMKHISEAKIHISSLNGEIGDLVKKNLKLFCIII